MTYLQEMLRPEKNANSSTNGQHRLSNVKQKRPAVLAKPRRCKPGAVNAFCKAWDQGTTPFLFQNPKYRCQVSGVGCQ